MASRHIDEETRDKWQRVANHLSYAAKALIDAEMVLILELGEVEGAPLDRVRAALDAVSGLSYLYTPQPEWMGGEVSKVRLPHIKGTT